MTGRGDHQGGGGETPARGGHLYDRHRPDDPYTGAHQPDVRYRHTVQTQVGPGREDDPEFVYARWNQPLRAHWDPTEYPEQKKARRSERQHVRRRSRFGRFVATYGWRAYALPVLAVVTILVVINAFRSGGDANSSVNPDLGTRSTSLNGIVGAPTGHFDPSVSTVQLPAGGPFTAAGKGTFHVVPGVTPQVGQGTQHVYTYTVDVENGVDTVGYGGDEAFASMVDHTLANPKSWIHDSKVGFKRVADPADADFHISLTSQMTVRRDCGYDIPVESSCFNADIKRVVVNEARWVRGAVSYQGDIGSYRQYLINHEVGHGIGYAHHQPCGMQGGLAPVMMQQTFSTSNDDIAKLDPNGPVPANGLTCKPNPWPYPRG